jgi:hypothetical protein
MWNNPRFGSLTVHDQLCTEATMTALKSVSLAVAAATLAGMASVMPAGAQPGGLVQVVTNGPQSNVEMQSPSWSARQNVIESQRYDRLVESSPAFRQARMHKECDPITDPQLHASCIASFGQMEPATAPLTRHRG